MRGELLSACEAARVDPSNNALPPADFQFESVKVSVSFIFPALIKHTSAGTELFVRILLVLLEN